MTWYYTKDTTRKLLKHISEFGDAAWYRVNTQKSLAFLYTNNRRSEKEIQETIPFNCCNKKTKRIKCQGINLSKESKDLYSKNYKIWCNKSKMTQRERYTMFLDWKNQYHQMIVLPKAVYRFNAISTTLPMAFPHRIRTKSLKICLETQKTPTSQSNLEKEKVSWKNEAPWLQTVLQSYSH